MPSNNAVKSLPVGSSFYRLKIIKQLGAVKFNNRKRTGYLCLCKCGKKTRVVHWNLIAGKVRSCGCLAIDSMKRVQKKYSTTHGMRFSIEHRSWAQMLSRCRNKNHHAYKDYGGRGIAVCKRWYKFENFYKDMGPRRSLGLSLDRIDNDKGYYKKNCRWATRSQQQRNRRDNARKIVAAPTRSLRQG